MKKIGSLIMLVLAVNFLFAAGGVGWLFQSGHLNKEKFGEVKKLLFPPVETAAVDPASTQPAAATQPVVSRLDELLARASGRTAGEQVEFIHQSFDVQAAQLDRRERDLLDLQKQADLAKQQVAADRAKLEDAQKSLIGQQQQTNRLATDKGFQDSLQLYTVMPTRQVKTIFLTLSDEVMQQYLEAMTPKKASKIIAEFKAPEETARIQRVLEKMRASQALAPSAAPTTGAAGQPVAQTPAGP